MFQKSNTAKQTYVPDLWFTVRVHDQHKVKTVKSRILPPRYYRRHGSPSHGNPVRRDPVTAVLPSMWSPLPRFSRGIPASLYRTDLYFASDLVECPVLFRWHSHWKNSDM